MQQYVPSEINGWKAQDEVETYDPETIFDYIDGAGEVYLMYDFQKVTVYHFTKAEQPSILLELFDMGSSQDAFGIFSHAREGEDQGIGQGSEYRGGLLCFWKNKTFVCVSSERETPEAKQSVEDLARDVAEKIEVTGAEPELLDCLPDEGLEGNTVRYFHKHTTLNYHYYIASENILNLSSRTEAVLATYQPDEAHLLCVRYPDQEQAKAALNSFLTAYIPEAQESAVAETEDGKWVAAEHTGLFLVVVFDAPAKAQAQDLVKAVKAKVQESTSEEGRSR
ncbi:MAG: hypothetical protein JSV10_01120 [Candidatus Zixiibacteriota bacterium]|nr:MAG: hypothetical protein JSV10_01120 [candidate division Zixibacteria bacterium]